MVKNRNNECVGRRQNASGFISLVLREADQQIVQANKHSVYCSNAYWIELVISSQSNGHARHG